MKNNDKSKNLILLIIGVLGTFAALYGLIVYNRTILPLLPLAVRATACIVTYWILAIAPVIMMIIGGDRLSDIGFAKNNLGRQLLIGVLAALAFNLVLTLCPILFGLGDEVGNGCTYTQLWQFIYEFAYKILAVSAVEELIFRGFVYYKLQQLTGRTWVAVLGSSILFGLFHIFGGNPLQVILTGLLGAAFCLLRLKIKNCTTLSLIICHGVYDAIISVLSATLLYQ